MRVKLNLVTLNDIQSFIAKITEYDFPIVVKDKAGHCVNAKSILGMLYSLEWKEIWCESEKDIYSKIKEFVVD